MINAHLIIGDSEWKVLRQNGRYKYIRVPWARPVKFQTPRDSETVSLLFRVSSDTRHMRITKKDVCNLPLDVKVTFLNRIYLNQPYTAPAKVTMVEFDPFVRQINHDIESAVEEHWTEARDFYLEANAGTEIPYCLERIEFANRISPTSVDEKGKEENTEEKKSEDLSSLTEQLRVLRSKVDELWADYGITKRYMWEMEERMEERIEKMEKEMDRAGI